MNTVLVSVIIPTRNRPEFLREAIQSVLEQTYPISQIIVVDDASALPESASAVADLSPVIEIVRLPTQAGPAAARNAGIELARGEFILFLDDDDLLHPKFVQEGLAALRHQPSAAGVFFLYKYILEFEGSGEKQPDSFKTAQASNPVPQAILENRPATAFIRFLVPINSCLLRRVAAGSARFPEMLLQGEDTYFWILLAAHGRRFILDERPYAFVRRHPGNTTRSRKRYIREIQECYEKLLEDGLLSDPDDIFLAHLKLLCFKFLTLRPGKMRHLNQVLSAPRHLAREIGYWFGSFRLWRRSLDNCPVK